MSDVIEVGDYRFEAPGPGSWEMDASHVTRPIAGVLGEVFEAALPAGMRDCCARYGMPVETLMVKRIHGFPYVQPKPLAGPPGAAPPPKLVFKLVCWLHPTMRKRLATAATLFERRPWLEELRRWDDEIKPATIAAHTELDAVDPQPMSDRELADHIRHLRRHGIRFATQDHSFNLAYMIPIGDFLAQTHRWTGLPHQELLMIFRGQSDISGGDGPERRRLVEAIADDDEARALLDSDRDPKAIYQWLIDHPGEVGEAMATFRVIVGNGIAHGLDLGMPTINEEPSSAIMALRASVKKGPRKSNGVATLEKKIRDRVPPEHRATFDDILGDAKLTYRLRDERHLYGALPACGLARRAIREVGRRLVERGELSQIELIDFAETEELCDALLAGRIDETTLAGRQRTAADLDATRIPLRLGPEVAPPPAEWMPNEGARRALQALNTFMQVSNADESAPMTEQLEGLPVSQGVYEGTARLCESAADLDRIAEGEILVAPTTTPAINVVLPILGAIVTDRGGALCHAAIVSREYGIPGVVGTRKATTTIADGDRIRVDGDRGLVTVIG